MRLLEASCIARARPAVLPSRRGLAAPILTRDRALLVGVCLDQARVYRKTFATNQTGHNARLDDMFEYATNDISIAEALIAGPREGRMIWDSILDPELAEPPIGEVHLHFTAEQPLRADREDIPHDQHPDHQLRIDRRATHGRIMRCKLAVKPRKIESSIDLPHQVIFGNRVAKLKLVEQLTLVTLQTAHHR